MNNILGTNRKVLLEEEKRGELMHGFTDNYIKVNYKYNSAKINSIHNFLLEEIDTDGNVLIS
jgi:threonylcarbamoyladenosine tRNA methylthiotransferase MtaB